jgi:hypothetical protein
MRGACVPCERERRNPYRPVMSVKRTVVSVARTVVSITHTHCNVCHTNVCVCPEKDSLCAERGRRAFVLCGSRPGALPAQDSSTNAT